MLVLNVFLQYSFCTGNLRKRVHGIIQTCIGKMAHRNNQSRTPRSLHHLQDDRLFSLSGGIPPEHFDDLNFVSMRRGRRLAAPAPTGDSLGILR